MEFFSFLPGIIVLILTIRILANIFDKKEEMIWRIWKIIFGIILLFLSIHLINLGFKEVKPAKYRVEKTYNYY